MEARSGRRLTKVSGDKAGLLFAASCYWLVQQPKRTGACTNAGASQEEEPMKLTVREHDLEALKLRLNQVRKASLAANQRGDFRAVGKLTCEAAQLNRAIQEAEGMLLAAA
jgi:hypothetical protein